VFGREYIIKGLKGQDKLEIHKVVQWIKTFTVIRHSCALSFTPLSVLRVGLLMLLDIYPCSTSHSIKKTKRK